MDNHGGVVTTAARLQAVALKRTGSADDLVALFAALLRSQGLLVRFVRCAPFMVKQKCSKYMTLNLSCNTDSRTRCMGV